MADQPASVVRRCLWVTADHFSSRLVFERHANGVWLVVRAGPSLANLVGLEPDRVKRFIEGNGWSHAWGDPVNGDA